MQSNIPEARRILRQFLITKMELLLLILVNGFVLLAVFYSLSTSHSKSVSEFQSFTEVYIIGTLFSWARSIVDMIITANVATMILWGIIGSFVYSLISGLQAALSDATDTFKTAFLYVHPAGYGTKQYIIQIILERLMAIIIALVTVVYVWSFVAYIMPVVFAGMKESISPLGMHSFLAVGYCTFLSLMLHGLAILYRIGTGRYKPDTI